SSRHRALTGKYLLPLLALLPLAPATSTPLALPLSRTKRISPRTATITTPLINQTHNKPPHAPFDLRSALVVLLCPRVRPTHLLPTPLRPRIPPRTTHPTAQHDLHT